MRRIVVINGQGVENGGQLIGAIAGLAPGEYTIHIQEQRTLDDIPHTVRLEGHEFYDYEIACAVRSLVTRSYYSAAWFLLKIATGWPSEECRAIAKKLIEQ